MHENTESNVSEEFHYFNVLIKKTIASGVFGILVFILGFPQWHFSLETMQGQLIWFVIGIISAIVIAYSGGQIYKGAWTAFMNHYATMDTLIAIGTCIAWIYSMGI